MVSIYEVFWEKRLYKYCLEDRSNLDLSFKKDTDSFFQENQPEVVILASGRVAGIIQNRDFPAVIYLWKPFNPA